jgi:hypothetical protein
MTSAWSTDSDLGASAFSSQNYHESLRHYTNALEKLKRVMNLGGESSTDKKQHQILLSNVIACRLKIGGEEMVERAVAESKEVRSLCFLLVLAMLM